MLGKGEKRKEGGGGDSERDMGGREKLFLRFVPTSVALHVLYAC